MMTLSTWLMAGFISLVIVAGFFGPYLISIILALLSILCAVVMTRPRRNHREGGQKPVV